jgi:alkylmercury lyase
VVNLDVLAKALCDVIPQYSAEERRLALKLYRLLAEEKPVALAHLANAVGISVTAAQELLEGISLRSNTMYDAAGDIIGFAGLAVNTMYHRLGVGRRSLYTWCAWDAFFLPPILGEAARLESRCPQTWEAISVTIGPHGYSEPSHSTALVSFVVPERCCGDVHTGIADFCQKVFLLASDAAAGSWAVLHPEASFLTLDQAFELGRVKNAWQFGEDVVPS